jgi:hypothetical protein
MGQSIDQALITQFSDMVHHKAQQMKARMKPHVKIKKMTGDVFAYESLNDIEAQELTSRFNKVVFSDIEHERRKLTRRQFSVTLPVDDEDVRGALINPEKEYATSIVAAMERVFDKVVIESAFADVQTGRDFGSTLTFAGESGLTVDATAGMTYAKLLEIQENFIDNEVGLEKDEGLFLTITGNEHTSLMGEVELTSGDFSREYYVEKGSMQMAAGLKLIKFGANANSPQFPDLGAGERNLIAASNSGLCVGISKDIELKITDRNDYVGVTQVQANFSLGCVRTEGKHVQLVRVTA